MPRVIESVKAHNIGMEHATDQLVALLEAAEDLRRAGGSAWGGGSGVSAGGSASSFAPARFPPPNTCVRHFTHRYTHHATHRNTQLHTTRHYTHHATHHYTHHATHHLPTYSHHLPTYSPERNVKEKYQLSVELLAQLELVHQPVGWKEVEGGGSGRVSSQT